MEKLWKVVLYNDHQHTFEDVILALASIGIQPKEGNIFAQRIHEFGFETITVGPYDHAARVAAQVRKFGLLVELDDTEDELLRLARQKLRESPMSEGEEWKYQDND